MNSLPKDDFVKVARGPPVMPAEWVEKFHQNGITAELVENLEMSHNHSIIVNPLGESYAEVDFANMTTFQRIRKYIEEGGVFVNVNGLCILLHVEPFKQCRSPNGLTVRHLHLAGCLEG